jgi:hypothetical protein
MDELLMTLPPTSNGLAGDRRAICARDAESPAIRGLRFFAAQGLCILNTGHMCDELLAWRVLKKREKRARVSRSRFGGCPLGLRYGVARLGRLALGSGFWSIEQCGLAPLLGKQKSGT